MSGRYARLKKDWMLRGWSDLPATLVNCVRNDQRQLNQMEFYVAESCDGQTDFDSFAFLPHHRALLELLLREGMAEACRAGDEIAPWQHYRKASNPRLTGIHWCVTGLCHLNCRHCYMEAPAGRYGQLPFKVMAGLVEQFEQANVLEVSLTGGEPFLRRDLLDLIQLLVEKKIRPTQIYSTGLLITDRHLDGLKNIGVRPSFQISFDGVGTHDQMRGITGTEQGVINAIRRLRAAGFRVVVATSIDRLNLGSLAKTYELMKALDIQAWRISAPQETGNWRGTKSATALDEQAEVCAPLLERWVQDGKPFGIQLGAFYRGDRPRERVTVPRGDKRRQELAMGRAMSLNEAAQTRATPRYTPEGFDCGACREQPNLLPDGTLVPCPGYVDSDLQSRMPNLLQANLAQVWTRSFLREIADLKKKDLLAANPECGACEWFPECGVGCRASALTATGNLLAKDPAACELSRKGHKQRFLEIAASAPQAQ
jgi:radical SAM protein with 4Fe4S-binding SPASM domain